MLSLPQKQEDHFHADILRCVLFESRLRCPPSCVCYILPKDILYPSGLFILQKADSVSYSQIKKKLSEIPGNAISWLTFIRIRLAKCKNVAKKTLEMCLQSVHSLVLIWARPTPVKIPYTSCVQCSKQYAFAFSIYYNNVKNYTRSDAALTHKLEETLHKHHCEKN